MGYGMMDGYGFGGLGLWGGLIGLLFNIAIIVAIIWLIVWAVRRFTSGPSQRNHSPANVSPRDIVQARYARGELTRDQYQQMMKDLS
jgi:putative membrane protein